MLKNLSIGMRLALGFGVVLALLLVVAVGGAVGLTSTTNSLNEVATNTTLAAKSEETILALTNMRRYAYNVVIALGDTKTMSEYINNVKEERQGFRARLDEIEALDSAPKTKESLKAWRKAQGEYETIVDASFDGMLRGQFKSIVEANQSYSPARGIMEPVEADLRAYVSEKQEAAAQARTSA